MLLGEGAIIENQFESSAHAGPQIPLFFLETQIPLVKARVSVPRRPYSKLCKIFYRQCALLHVRNSLICCRKAKATRCGGAADPITSPQTSTLSAVIE
jgi:hypothetical protein